MPPKLFSTIALLSISIASLGAQTPVRALQYESGNPSEIGLVVGQLGENALMIFIGIVALIGIVWFLAICNACIGLGKKQKNKSVFSLILWFVFATFTSILNSSCSAEQIARATDIQATQAPEGGYCLCHAPSNNRPYYCHAGIYNQYPYSTISSGIGRQFCRQCGRRVFNYNR